MSTIDICDNVVFPIVLMSSEIKMLDQLNALNPRQYEAVTAPEQSVLVLAGAGSGKTRVLTTRIAYLLSSCNVLPSEILAVTFTNKAAKEMVTRLESMIQRDFRRMWVGTFHGLCHRILRAHAVEAGLPTTFQIIDQGDQLSAIKRIMKTRGIDTEKMEPRTLQNYINWNKENAIRAGSAHDDVDGLGVKLYKDYETLCQKEGIVDFAELLLRTFELLERNEIIRAHYQDRFRHILVDEFQDTNTLQYRWIKLLAGLYRTDRKPNCVFAVGDDDQSIYSFRGACVGNMKSFLTDFHVKEPIRLEENYRSTSVILEAANALISNNANRLGKNLWTSAGRGELVDVVEHSTDLDEANWVAKRIRSAPGKYVNHAILYRTNSQSRVIESALQNAGIPYRVYGGLRFFERAEVKHVLAYLRLLVNPDDDTSFLRVVNFPTRGIGAKSIQTLQEEAQRLGLSLWGTMESASANFPARLSFFTELIDAMRREAAGRPLPDVIKLIMRRSGLEEHYGKERDGEDRLANMAEIISAARGYMATENIDENHDAFEPFDDKTTPILGFLTQSTLEAGDKNEQDDVDAVQLMTVHSAKGLEFPYVYIVGVEEGIFPHFASRDKPDGVDEERRLMYVAITRAQRHLAISHCQTRRMYDKERDSMPSSFLEQIPAELTKVKSLVKPAYNDYGSSRSRGWDRPSFGGERSYERSSRYGNNDRYGSNDRYGNSRYGDRNGRDDANEWTQRDRSMDKKDNEFLNRMKTVKSEKYGNQWGYIQGDRVDHPKFGKGTISLITGMGDDTRAVIEFDNGQRRELLLAIAHKNLVKLPR